MRAQNVKTWKIFRIKILHIWKKISKKNKKKKKGPDIF